MRLITNEPPNLSYAPGEYAGSKECCGPSETVVHDMFAWANDNGRRLDLLAIKLSGPVCTPVVVVTFLIFESEDTLAVIVVDVGKEIADDKTVN